MSQGKRYSPEMALKVRARIADLVSKGHDYAMVAHIMGQEGIRTPSGGVPDKTFVGNQTVTMRRSGVKVSRYKLRKEKSRATEQKTTGDKAGPSKAASPELDARFEEQRTQPTQRSVGTGPTESSCTGKLDIIQKLIGLRGTIPDRQVAGAIASLFL